ncbi:hypothetical protein [Agrobacterium radiobacter]|uniref:hypothetical protein n=1 Tax=Agrobacterium radiobacter TaxID=362 RepID=UPI003F84709A
MRPNTAHATTFAPVGKIAFDQLIAHLRSGARYPLRVAMIGTATFIDDDPVAEPISYDRTISFAECGSIHEALVAAGSTIARDDIQYSAGSAVRYAPRIVTVTDRDGCLVAAGEVCSRTIEWCEPVKSDSEARMIVTEASRLRGRTFVENGADYSHAARDLRFNASILEGRLVDRFWREPARVALRQVA